MDQAKCCPLNLKISADISSDIIADLVSNPDQIMWLYVSWICFTHFHVVFNCILQPTRSSYWCHIQQVRKAIIVADKAVNFCGPRSDRSQEIWPKAIGSHIFNSFVCDDFRLETATDITSSVAVDKIGMDVRIKFGDSSQTVFEIYVLLTLCWMTLPITNEDNDDDSQQRSWHMAKA